MPASGASRQGERARAWRSGKGAVAGHRSRRRKARERGAAAPARTRNAAPGVGPGRARREPSSRCFGRGPWVRGRHSRSVRAGGCHNAHRPTPAGRRRRSSRTRSSSSPGRPRLRRGERGSSGGLRPARRRTRRPVRELQRCSKASPGAASLPARPGCAYMKRPSELLQGSRPREYTRAGYAASRMRRSGWTAGSAHGVVWSQLARCAYAGVAIFRSCCLRHP